MDKKCSKYEGLFIFSDNETFQQHIEECEECKQEHQKMQRVSELIGEVKHLYKNKQRKKVKLRAACAIIFVMFFSAVFGVLSNDPELADVLMYGDSLSAEELGLPVDSYGLIMVD